MLLSFLLHFRFLSEDAPCAEPEWAGSCYRFALPLFTSAVLESPLLYYDSLTLLWEWEAQDGDIYICSCLACFSCCLSSLSRRRFTQMMGDSETDSQSSSMRPWESI